jgi:hypothetical protein
VRLAATGIRERKELRMRKRLGAILLALGLPMALLGGSMLAASPAWAQPVSCDTSCIPYNLVTGTCNGIGYNLMIYGETHNAPLSAQLCEGDAYYSVSKDGVWGWMRSVANGECWNESGGKVYLDSCVNDHNELFDWVACPSAPHYWCIHNYALGNTLNLAANKSGVDLYFTSGDNHTSEWGVLS